MKMIYPLFVLTCLISTNVSGQVITLNSNQPLPLAASAGNDVTVVSGNSAVLGDNPSASDGYGGYVYLWTPAAGLDDPTLPNPSSGTLLLDLQGATGTLILRIYNSTGIVVHEIYKQADTNFRESVDTRTMPKGNYFITVSCNGKLITKPLIIL